MTKTFSQEKISPSKNSSQELLKSVPRTSFYVICTFVNFNLFSIT